MTPESKTQELRRFLKALDNSDLTVTDWEAKFIENNMEAESFSPRQRESIEEMLTKYGNRIKW